MKTISLLLLLACTGLFVTVQGGADDGLEEFRQPEDDARYFWASHIKPRPFGRLGWRQDPYYEQCRTDIYYIYSCLPEIRRSYFYPKSVLSKQCCDNLRNIQEECFHRAVDGTFIAFKYWFKQHCPSTVPEPPSGGGGGEVPSPPSPAPTHGGDGGSKSSPPTPAPAAGGVGGQVPSQPSPAPTPSTGGDGGSKSPPPAPAPAAGGDGGQVPSQPSPAPTPSTGGDEGSKSPAPAPAPAPADDDYGDLCDLFED